MKWEERMSFEYLQSKGFTDIQVEPDGKIPPDLLLNKQTAIEVRRLNQFYRDDKGKYLPLEDLEYRLVPRVYKIINSYKTKTANTTSFVSISFSRPLKVDKHLLQDIDHVFESHLDFLEEPRIYQVHQNFRLRIHPAKKKFGYPYTLGSTSDFDGGGAVVANIVESLNIIISEKVEKIRPHKHKYPVWWLALVDRIGYGIDEIDFGQLKAAYQIGDFFEKIILISAFDSNNGVEWTTKQ